MVLWYKSNNNYNYSFDVVTYSWLNRYPNPFAKHVISVDTIEHQIDEKGNLHITRLIRKQGNVPTWAKPLFRNITTSWIIEKIKVDPQTKYMQTYTTNLEHTKIIRVQQYTNYVQKNNDHVDVISRVKFSSQFRQVYGLGIKDRIENWSHSRFIENINKSRQGLLLVIKNFNALRGEVSIATSSMANEMKQ